MVSFNTKKGASILKEEMEEMFHGGKSMEENIRIGAISDGGKNPMGRPNPMEEK